MVVPALSRHTVLSEWGRHSGALYLDKMLCHSPRVSLKRERPSRLELCGATPTCRPLLCPGLVQCEKRDAHSPTFVFSPTTRLELVFQCVGLGVVAASHSPCGPDMADFRDDTPLHQCAKHGQVRASLGIGCSVALQELRVSPSPSACPCVAAMPALWPPSRPLALDTVRPPLCPRPTDFWKSKDGPTLSQ